MSVHKYSILVSQWETSSSPQCVYVLELQLYMYRWYYVILMIIFIYYIYTIYIFMEVHMFIQLFHICHK